jgi:nucleotide-binding universal stress UspA family protein
MSIRTILAAASGGSATAGAIGLGCQLARRFEAHLEGFHVLPDPTAVFAATDGGMGAPASVGLVETVMAQAVTQATQTRALFEDIIRQHRIPHSVVPQLAACRPSASWHQETGSAPALVARRGRFFDLVVLGRSERVINEPHSNTIEDTVLSSGRPVLLAPSQAAPSGIGNVIAVAWNGSSQAVRALTAALPLLYKANAVSLITTDDLDPDDSQAAINYLAWHNVNAEQRWIEAGSGRHIGRALIDEAQYAAADLLVMGGYGHAPWRELFLGGVTRTALATMPLPLLLVH